MFKGLSTIEGTFNQNGVEIKYWSKYTSDGKTMYFEPKKRYSATNQGIA